MAKNINANDNVIDFNEALENAIPEAIDLVVPEVPGINWGKVGFGTAAALAGAGLIYGTYKFIKTKVDQKKAKEADAKPEVDNVKIAERDFVEKESEEA